MRGCVSGPVEGLKEREAVEEAGDVTAVPGWGEEGCYIVHCEEWLLF